MKTQFTPGPWIMHNHTGSNVGHYDGYVKSEIRAGGHTIFIRQSVAGKTFPELGANARLIAAAPEMYEALEFALIELRAEWGNPANAITMIESVLAKIGKD